MKRVLYKHDTSTDITQPHMPPETMGDDDTDTDDSSASDCTHDPVADNLIERDEKHPGIYVCQILSSELSSTGRRKSSAE